MSAFLVGSINLLIKALGAVLTLVCGLLPNSPFQALDSSPIAEFLPGLNYFVPVQQILDIGAAWLVAVGSYSLYQIVLRWAKAIQ